MKIHLPWRGALVWGSVALATGIAALMLTPALLDEPPEPDEPAAGNVDHSELPPEPVVRLHGPQLDDWPGARPARRSRASRQALALYFTTSIFAGPARRPRVIGSARRGARVAVLARRYGHGCTRGRWYQLEGGGYACTSEGFLVETRPGPFSLHHALPDLSRPLPYRYVKVIREGAERLYRPPTAAEEEAIRAAAEGKGSMPEVVEKAMRGVTFLAIDEHDPEGPYLCTARGRFVRAEDVEPRPTPEMHGEVLGRELALPLAFVFGEDRSVFELRDGEPTAVGIAQKHARFPVLREVELEGRRFVVGPDQTLLLRDRVRVARKVPRPGEVPSSAKWIHVDLSEQTLVAYRGSAPVFATVVSSGKEGFEPPTGIFRIRQKHLTTTMSGPDDTHGWYEVEEVPFTLYYSGSYAIHGTYWHDDFGSPRSHGCTNLAPLDARWLFRFADPALPAGWHSREGAGTWVQITS